MENLSPGEDNTKIHPSEVSTSIKTYEETVSTRAITTRLYQISAKSKLVLPWFVNKGF
jgi:hypothetical protein